MHRFTHRVVRGLLIAVGRPDGRLCCLSKSEAAILLSAKQVIELSILFYLILSYLILSYLILSYLILSYLSVAELILSYSTL